MVTAIKSAHKRELSVGLIHQGDALVLDHHLGGEGLVFVRDTEKRPSGLKTDCPMQASGQLMTAEARV